MLIMRQIHYTLLFLVSLLFVNCGNNPNTESRDVQSSDTTGSLTEKLQGKWQHEEDSTNFLVFDGQIRREIAAGMDDWDQEPYRVSDHCENVSGLNAVEEKEKDRYITCPESDLCWYIISLDDAQLSLQFIGRGNTLNYRRVKDGGHPTGSRNLFFPAGPEPVKKDPAWASSF